MTNYWSKDNEEEYIRTKDNKKVYGDSMIQVWSVPNPWYFSTPQYKWKEHSGQESKLGAQLLFPSFRTSLWRRNFWTLWRN